MNDQKKEATVSNEAALSDTDLDKVAAGFKSAEHTTVKSKSLPHPLPGNAKLEDWLE